VLSEPLNAEAVTAGCVVERVLLDQLSADHCGQPVLVVAAEHKHACCVVLFRWNLHDLVHEPHTTVLTKRAVERIRSSGVPVYEAYFVGDTPLIRRYLRTDPKQVLDGLLRLVRF
jgi:hypothetical protein